MSSTVLIVPALTDQAGQCRIVMASGTYRDALSHYRENSQQWKDIGLMNSQGKIVCLEVNTTLYEEMKDCEPLYGGMVFTLDD